MENFKNFFSIKNIKKISILFGFIGAAITITTVALLKVNKKYKPAFYNYKSYMNDSLIDKFNEKFEYKTFNEISEFTAALNNFKVSAGIGSDFQAISLIKKNLIQPINFSKLLKIDIKNDDELKKILKKIYTPDVFKHLESYDDQLLEDAYGNKFEQPKHLWKYFVPYYAQDGIIAYNPIKNQNNVINKNRFFKNDVYDNSITNILDVISKNNYKDLVITDAVRVNMLYGSSEQNHNNKTNETNYKESINDFIYTIENSTKTNISTGNHISFNSDGQGIIASLLDKNRIDVSAAIMYNGDALDAYFSEGNGFTIFDNKENKEIEIPNGTIETIKFKNNILLVDGLVVAKGINSSLEDDLYSTLNTTIYNDMAAIYNNKTIEQYQLKMYDEYLNNLYRDKIVTAYNHKNLRGVSKFEEFKSELRDIYLSGLKQEFNNDILKSFNAYISKKINNDQILKESLFNTIKANDEQEKLDLISFKLSHIDFLDEKYYQYLENKYPNYINFDFINYTPSNIAEYELIKRNYFVNQDNTFDFKALEIYQISDQNNTINHNSVNGVDDKLDSLLTTYYYSKIKH
ncbi:hypothetical protein JXZ92_03090 [Mycoplasma sp. CSL10137]|uniref:hypothetical protein n=2 Tax=unclassified Mycoplasma TaxID=2683645 RepID=UPI00197C10EA|nr:hypothetical protein [Mycoplasma sp. CSL10137]MBN4083788.1 hypothetical protein [Mycoplasma sp. CSL10137]